VERAARVDSIRSCPRGGTSSARHWATLDFLVVAVLAFFFARLVLKEEKLAKK
jgi:hypothetical protein